MHHLIAVMGLSERFACRVTGQHRATQRHKPASTTPEDPDAALRAWLRDYAKDHPRRGFRAAYHDARAEGWIVIIVLSHGSDFRNLPRSRCTRAVDPNTV